MRHALIITAYNDLEFLLELCRLYGRDFLVYIHIDRKTKKNFLREFNLCPNVKAVSRYKVNWGSSSHVLAVLDLLRMALADGADYVHIISANTLPVRSPAEIKDFFDKNRGRVFMEVKHRDDGLYREFAYRYTAYFFEHLYNLQGPWGRVWRRIEPISAAIQRKLRMRTNVSFAYKGLLYAHMPSDAVEYVFAYLREHKDYLKEIKYCRIGEEFFFQNILMESEYAEKVVNDCLIYAVWEPRDGVCPAVLDEGDLEAVQGSGCLFARKFTRCGSRRLFERIKQRAYPGG